MQQARTYRPMDGRKLRVGIVVSRFNQNVTDGLLAAARDFLAASRVPEKQLTIIDVPGSAEIPFALSRLAASGRFHCLIALGCVIRGETPHFDYVAALAQQGVLRVSLDFSIPIGFGIITANAPDQAKARHHLGSEAAAAALELALKPFPRRPARRG